MLVSDLIQQINDALRGIDDDAPTSGTDEYEYWLRTANRKKNEWAKDSKNVWKSNFAVRTVGPIVAGTQTYTLAADLLMPSDTAVVTMLSGNDMEFTITTPQERERYSDSVYLSGPSPVVLTFPDTISTGNQIVGGSLKLPGYYVPADMDDAADAVPIDDPYWLVYAVASEVAFNDITYEEKYGDLNAKANNLYRQMVTANRKGTYNNPRRAQTSMSRVLGTNYRWFE